jgi:hypothetical protein
MDTHGVKKREEKDEFRLSFDPQMAADAASPDRKPTNL